MSNERAGVRKADSRARRKKKRQQQIIRRAAICVVAIFVLAAVIALVVNLANNPAKKAANESTLTLEADGTVVVEEISDFDKDVYDKAELESYANSLIKSFNDTNGKNVVTLEEFKVKKDKAYLRTVFDSMEDYSMFSSYSAYENKMDAALDEGYEFMDEVIAVEEGKKLAGSLGAINPYDYTGYYVLVIEENITVSVPGKICFVTDVNTEIVDESTVRISQPDGNSDAVDTVYIIYDK